MQKNAGGIPRKRKRKLARRLARRPWSEQAQATLQAHNIQYEMAERSRTRRRRTTSRGALRRPTYRVDGDSISSDCPCTANGVRFAFGMDARPNLLKLAKGLEPQRWRLLERRERRPTGGPQRRRPRNVKARIGTERGFRNLTLQREAVAEFAYQPTKCARPYRMIALPKTVSVEEGQQLLFDEVRYFFYITNLDATSPAEAAIFCNARCNQENLIEQLKNGLHALRMPVGDLEANWAYMVMVSSAWTLKAWFALPVRRREQRDALLRMEFRRFLHASCACPCRSCAAGAAFVYRLLTYNEWVSTLLHTFDTIRALRLT